MWRKLKGPDKVEVNAVGGVKEVWGKLKGGQRKEILLLKFDGKGVWRKLKGGQG